MGVAIDPQVNGWFDSGHESGAVHVSDATGEAARVPFRAGQYYASVTGGAATVANSALLIENPDGTGSSLTVTVPAGLGPGARLWYPFGGSLFGVRWQAADGTPDFSVSVDGEAVLVEGRDARVTAEGITTQLLDTAAQAITHRHLDPTERHLAELTFVSDASASRSWTLFGVLLDRRAGYQEPIRRLHNIPPVTLTTSQVAIGVQGANAQRVLSGVRKVVYYNGTAGAVDVTIQYNGTAVWKKSLAAGEVVEFDFGGVTAVNALWTHAASAGSSITATVIGGY